MRLVTGLLRALVVAALALGVFLLATDPQLRSLAGEDLSSLISGTESSRGGSTTTASNPSSASKAPKSESSPTVTASGYTIAPRCALWTVEGLDLYYSPADPATICVQPPDSPIQSGSTPASGAAQLPPNCALAPDGVVYCVADKLLSPDTLGVFYGRGELQTPREP